ncbi:MAG: cbb3-type cytochrome oxidase assembly protein CcoS [Gammaproteobacteria bacterium]|nr:cbb3-type cytochrome oxidase assembly protein CcoS [Gammaproteobacteria bacterium]
MEIIFLLIPISTLLIVIAVLAFIWAVRSGQFDDMDSPAWRILLDDEGTGNRRDDKPAREQREERR